ncbi:MarR family transcriptional regulator [Inquilinus sp. CAU 1745]|uniref:MarR family transcriptional regulator n=1 Tax=Inquilinus sp. CAU 1745 TaxID=3140369 RepID=UPI00325A4EED
MDTEMQMQTALIFIHVAEAGANGVSQQKLRDLLGLAQASISRNVAALSKVHRKGRLGHNLIVAQENPNNRREKIVYLTDQGRRVLSTIEGLLEE